MCFVCVYTDALMLKEDLDELVVADFHRHIMKLTYSTDTAMRHGYKTITVPAPVG